MDEKQAYERVTAEYERHVRSDSRLEAFRRKLTAGGTNGVSAITLKDAHAYVDRLAQIFGECFGRAVLDIAQGEREGTCMRLMRDRVTDIDEVSEGAQSAVLARQGLNISPKPEAYPEKRIFTLAHSLEDPTATDEQIVRRADSASATVMRSRFDENMKKGARTCAEAGLKTYIVRDGSSKCCEWCAGLAGRYSYGSEPKDVYRRHDNCSCSVVYESGRGRQNVWSKQYWSAEQEQEYLRLRDEMAPKRLNAKQAQALREQVGGLTFGGKSATMYYDHITDFNGSENLPPVTLAELEKRISVIPGNLQKELSRFVSKIHLGEENQTSGYSPVNHDIRLNPKTGAESLIHELGHAFGDMRNLYNDPEFIDILTDGLDLSNGYGIATFRYGDKTIGLIKSPKFVNEQQGRVYADFSKIDYSKPISPNLMQEYISEVFDAFFNRPEELKNKDPRLYDYLKRSIYG